ncbi:MAG: C4-dicarboxylate ABC transporter substrate-binding protein [Blastopirellula sp.]|nr:MAG: C4-dicarboxylate ABC transporter substrate-binding protein [Blastopirellula sp.]
MNILKTGNFVAAMILATTAFSLPGNAQTIGIGTNPQGSLAYATGAAIAKVVSDNTELKARVIPQGGPVVTIPLVSSGELEFSISNAIPLAFAQSGKAMFKGRPQPGAKMVAAFFNLNVGFFVKKDSSIKSIADLKGKKISTQFVKQKNLALIGRAILATAGLTFDDVDGVPVPNGVRGVEDFIAGKIDAGSFSVTSGKVKQANAAVGGIRWLTIADTPEANAILAKIAPGSFVQVVKPSPGRPGMDQPTGVFAAPFLLVAGVNTPDDVVYKMVKTLHANKAGLVASHKAFNGFQPDAMARDLGIPIHPGAAKFYKEIGIGQ